jgi:hypothetical protein
MSMGSRVARHKVPAPPTQLAGTGDEPMVSGKFRGGPGRATPTGS